MSSILNKPVPNVNVPVLEPIPYKQIIPKLKTLTRNLAEKHLNNFADWLLSYTPPTIKTKVTESVRKILNRVATSCKSPGKSWIFFVVLESP